MMLYGGIVELYLNVVTCKFPFKLRDDVYNLMEKETNNSDGEANNAHHQPPKM